MPQRKIIDLGKIVSRVVSLNQILDMGIKGFRQDLIASSMKMIKHEIAMLVSSYKFQTEVSPIEGYKEDGNWLNFC
jgi:hypothetical protein